MIQKQKLDFGDWVILAGMVFGIGIGVLMGQTTRLSLEIDKSLERIDHRLERMSHSHE